MFLEKRVNVDNLTDEEKALRELKGENGEVVELAYWRKVNHIHKWFADNVYTYDDVNDDGNNKEFPVDKEQLTKLLETIKMVLTIHEEEFAKEHLPTCSGFFFGETEYDNYYWSELENSKVIIEKILEETDFEKELVSYHASW